MTDFRKDFRKRIKRIEHKHAAFAGGARLVKRNGGLLEMVPRRRIGLGAVVKAGAMLAVFAVGAKVALLVSLGTPRYDAVVAGIAQDSFAHKMAISVLAPDAYTSAAAERLSGLLASRSEAPVIPN